MNELKTQVLEQARDKDWMPDRALLDQIGKHLPVMPIKDPLKTWWSAMVIAHLSGHNEATSETRDAHQMLLLAEKPDVRDEDDWDISW